MYKTWLIKMPLPQVHKVEEHFLLGGLNYFVLLSKNKYNLLIIFILFCKTLLLLLRRDAGNIKDRFGGMGRLRVG